MRNWVFEAVSLTLFLALGAAGAIAASQIKGFSFDPLGSAAAPYAVCGFTALLSLMCVWTLAKSVISGHRDEEERVFSLREITEVLALFGFVLIYVIALFVFRIPFSLATLAMIPVAACLLERTLRGPIPLIALGTGAFIGFGGELLFTKVFFIDLPTLW